MLLWGLSQFNTIHTKHLEQYLVPCRYLYKASFKNTIVFLHCCHCSVAQSFPTLCSPMDCSTPGFPVLHHPPELAQTHVHWVGDAIQPSRPLSSPSLPAFSISQHQGFLYGALQMLLMHGSQNKTQGLPGPAKPCMIWHLPICQSSSLSHPRLTPHPSHFIFPLCEFQLAKILLSDSLHLLSPFSWTLFP